VQQPAENVAAERRQQFVGKHAVDEDERHPRGPLGPVLPAVRRAALHDDITRAKGGLAVVEHQHDLAVEHDPVVHGLRAMHGGDDAGRELVDPDLGTVRRRRDG
jgi:hypothetical protein